MSGKVVAIEYVCIPACFHGTVLFFFRAQATRTIAAIIYKQQYLQPICIKHKVFELLHCVLTSAARSAAMFRLERASIMAAVNSVLVCSKDLSNGE